MLDADSRARSLARRFDHVLAALDAYDDRRETLTPAAVDLVEAVRAAVTGAQTAFDQQWDQLDTIVSAALRDKLRAMLCVQILRLLGVVAQSLLPTLDGAASRGIPVEFDAVLARLTQFAAPTPPRIVMSSAPGFQYSVQQVLHPTQVASQIMRTAGPTAGPDYLFLLLPRLERDSALLHVIMAGHEIGHVRDWHRQTSQTLALGPLALNGKPVTAAESAVYKLFLGNWASEIVADVYGVLTFGPAALLSFTELILTVAELAGDSFSHPAPNRRIEIMIRVLDGLGFRSLPEVEDAIARLRVTTDGAAGHPLTLRADLPVATAAWEWLKAQLPSLIATCRSHLHQDEVLGPGQWPAVERAASELAKGRPYGEQLTGPGPSGVPVDLDPVPAAVILNGGWLVRTRHYAGLRDVVALEGREQRQSAGAGAVLDGLLLKSLEISEWRHAHPWSG